MLKHSFIFIDLKSSSRSEQELLLLGSSKRLLETVDNYQEICNIDHIAFAMEYDSNSVANRITCEVIDIKIKYNMSF